MGNSAIEIETQLKSLEETQRAILNILEDAEDEKNLLGNTQRAVMNILEDYSVENARVEKMNIKLLSSNKEIEQFAYIASHDLQEPLRTISNYTGLFQKRFKGKLGEEADKHLDFIAGATRRMQSLIRDLLDYSRIEVEKNKIAVNCDLLIADILSDMTLLITESKAQISATHLPVISGYLSGLKSLFQNLITNAIKFRKKNASPIITITAEVKSNEWAFAIKDDGIGIDKLFYNKLFVIFQRLHNKDEYSGTGIGLAQCKKIVDLHGGRIWVESELEKGSTFYFTIPKQ
jgi:light-regulated signal transduction histidine kinase (bacteriophytochrome)